MRFARTSTLLSLGAAALLGLSTAASAQMPPGLDSFQAPMNIDSGYVSNDGTQETVVFATLIQVKDAPWLQINFAEVLLAGDESVGTNSYLRMTSAFDGAVQHHRPTTISQWQNTSAYFNGEAVYLELIAQPGTGVNRVLIEEVTAGEGYFDPTTTICEQDDRVLSYIDRNGRLMPITCTTWIIDDPNHQFISAGHCVSGGNGDYVQFNVPLSLSNGTLQHPGPEDQYAADSSSLQYVNGGVGNDWGYFGCYPNTETGLTPYQAQRAYYELASSPDPVSGQFIRITGYGSDSGTYNHVQQTNAGPYYSFSGSTVQYRTDTTGGNSGSSVLDEATGLAIGVHTHGGCFNGGGANSGTGINNAGWQNALANPRGVCIPINCPGDFDGDLIVDQADLGHLLSYYGNGAGGDIDGDGDTDQADLGALLGNFNVNCAH
jgi:V8-like Glu-specific endopeptidase